MISFKNVSVVFNKDGKDFKAVDNVSLDIQKGQFYGIVGTSGAGKSTLVRTVNQLQKVSSGQVIVDGVDVTKLSNKELCDLRLHIGMIFQHFNLIKNASIYDNVAFALKASHTNKDVINQRVDELLSLVGLSDKKHMFPSDLSGGQKQRVAIARALANNPKILLCDEATSALDPETTKEIVLLLKEIKKKYPLTILFITHQMEVAKSLFDKIAVMSDGCLIESNDAYSIFAHPQHEKTKSLVKQALYLDIPKEVLFEKAKYLLITYKQECAYEGVIAYIAKNYKVEISILAGKIEYILQKPLGILAISLKGSDQDVAQALTYLESKAFIHEFSVGDLC